MALNQYQFHEQLIIRTPTNALSEREKDWQEIICDKRFQEAIRISSYDLHRKLQEYIENNDSLEQAELKRLKRSVSKYWARMCTRTTPFGLFASVGVADWSSDARSNLRLSSSKIKRKTRLDMSYLYSLARSIEEDAEISCNLKYFPNSSIYLMGEDYRFLESDDIESRRNYKITAVSQSSHLKKVLESAEGGMTLIDLMDMLCTQFQLDRQDVYLYLSELVDCQVLVSELEPRVTGTDFFSQITSVLKRLSQIPSASKYLEVLTGLEDYFNELDRNIWKATLDHTVVSSKLEKLGVATEKGRLIQVDSFTEFDHAKVDGSLRKSLREGIEALMKCQAPRENEDLKRFIKKFNERFEGKMVPLTEALDPETGIGYPDHGASDLYDLGAGIEITQSSPLSTAWDDFETWSFKKLMSARNNGQYEFELTNKDLESFPKYEHELAPSIGVLFRALENGDVMIESAGGSSAINLLGRFAHGSPEIHSLIQDVANKEEEQNPEVIFAEIAHLPESRMGNILQRPAVRPYEIPYLANSGVDDEFQVHIQDLYLKVVGGSIQLWSNRLGKQVIPRLTSAHNFKLSDLPVYKFLCDLQTFEKSSSLVFNWGSVKDQFQFFPRVRYKKAILSPATWKLSVADIMSLQKIKDPVSRRFHLANFRESWMLPEQVVLAEGDNELLIDLTNPDSVELLFDAVKKKDEFLLKEALCLNSAQIADADDRIHANQMLACLISDENRYENTASKVFTGTTTHSVCERFSPGSEWLYYKFYCGDKTSDILLENVLNPLVSKLKQKNQIGKWFFIRYNDGDPHIRFRVRLQDIGKFGEVVAEIGNHIRPFEEQKLIWRTEIATYERELDRYGYETMELAEQYFAIDSEAGLRVFEQENQAEEESFRWKYVLRAINDTLSAFHLNSKQRMKLAETIKDSFADEFKIDKKVRKELDQRYRKYQEDIASILGGYKTQDEFEINEIANERLNKMSDVVTKMIEVRSRKDQDWLPGMVASLNHMTVNRVMVNKQRFYEMILYYFLAKYYRSKVAREEKMTTAA